MPILKKWAVCGGSRVTMHLVGEVYGHDRYREGEKVRTAPIREVIGDSICTASGTIYRLDGPPEEGFAKFLTSPERGIEDPSNPLTAAVNRAIGRAKAAGGAL